MAGASEQKIRDAAEQLKAEGVPINSISARKIIEITGGRNATVAKVLQEWKEHEEYSQSLKSVEIPLVLSEKLNLFGAEIWRDASKMAEIENVALREQLMRMQSDMKEQSEQFVKDTEAMEQRYVEWREEHEEMLQQKNDDIEYYKKEYAKASGSAGNYNRDLKAATKELDAANALVKEQSATIARLTDELAKAKEEIARTEGKNDLAEITAIIKNLIADEKGKK